MRYALAPMEGVTGHVFRQAHAACFGPADKYLTPFLSPNQNLCFTSRERAEVLPEHNDGLNVVPQLLTSNAAHFLWASRELAAMGYREVNLNLGCPSGTVSAKGKGAGFLAYPDRLERFLDQVFSYVTIDVSVKTRIGKAGADEWDSLLELFNRYPICELTVHPRVQADFYQGRPNRRAFRKAVGASIQFGEGGAGAFSDGKLNTGTRDPRHRFILETLVSCGAPEDILIDAKPHVGTDYLHTVLVNLRRRLLELGTDIRFESRLADLDIRDGALRGITAEGPEGVYTLPCSHLLLCPGHSARDTFAMLHKRGVPMEAKPFAVGVRIEHRQADCDAAQYRQYAGHPGLPASTYKLSCHLPGGRAAYSFCVCPGGEVVAAASEAERVVTNGMSEFARDKENINGGLLVNVTPEDYGGAEDPLAGIAFQRKLESAAYALGGGDYRAPAQRVGDFLAGRPSVGPGRVHPSYRPGVTWTDLRRCLPPFVADTIAGALPLLGQKLRGYDDPDAVLTAVESRSSSPVRIPRDGTCQSSLRGLYPCGEGAGYAGGILSAAADGMHCAEQLCQSIQKESDCL